MEKDGQPAAPHSNATSVESSTEIAEKDSITVTQIVNEAFKDDSKEKERVVETAKELSESDHERVKGALPTSASSDEASADLSVGPVINESRREFLRATFWAALISAPLSWASEKAVFDPIANSAATALKRARHGKSFDLNAPLAEQIRLKRSNAEDLSRLQESLIRSDDAYHLVGIIKRYNEGGSASDPEITYLNEIARGDVCTEIRYLCTNHLSSELNRRGRPSLGLEQLKSVDEENIPGDQLPNHLLQLINLTYNQNLQSVALTPDMWRIQGFLEKVTTNYHDELNMRFKEGQLQRVPDFTDAEVGRGAKYLSGVYAHLIFFAFHYEAMRLRDEKDRRKLWDQQLFFYRKLLDRRIVNNPFTWQVWNHLFLLALSAWRVSDIDYMKKFIGFLFGDRQFWENLDVDAHIHARKISLNEQYIFAVILVEALKLRGVTLPTNVDKFDTELPYLIRLSGRIPHAAASRAMNEFRKWHKVPIPTNLAVLPFITSIDSHDIYVAEIR